MEEESAPGDKVPGAIGVKQQINFDETYEEWDLPGNKYLRAVQSVEEAVKGGVIRAGQFVTIAEFSDRVRTAHTAASHLRKVYGDFGFRFRVHLVDGMKKVLCAWDGEL